ncbi:MAG: hypothetical protein EXR77_01175 [Myxococcales bacterium]|nr:hypothetical protein [Myxococcales bacterium]
MATDLADPVAFGLLAYRVLTAAGLRCSLYGGLALGIYGRARLTADADFAVAAADSGLLVAAFAAQGLPAQANFDGLPHGGLLLSRATVFGVGEFIGSNVVDVVAPRDSAYGELALNRSPTARLRGSELAILTPEDFVVFKAISDRPVDLEDAASVVARMAGDLDIGGIALQIKRLAPQVSSVNVLDRWATIQMRACSFR